jgi:hypothetical protein
MARRGAGAVGIPASELDTSGDLVDPSIAMRHTLASLARRWFDLHPEIKIHSKHLKALTRAAAPQLLDAFGVGLDIAAQMLITAGDNSDRVRNEAAFAKMCGVAPIPTGSGKTSGRHRLNRGGNRQANAALYRAVIVRMRWHAPTIAYVERRTADGLSKKDIIRCLKRYLARELFQLLPDTRADRAPAPVAQAAQIDVTIYRSINAVAESFWESLKRECVQGRVFATRAEARRAIFRWFNWYNASRLHSTLNDVAPLEWEQRYRQAS